MPPSLRDLCTFLSLSLSALICLHLLVAPATYGGSQLGVWLQATRAAASAAGERFRGACSPPPPLLLAYRRVVVPAVTDLLELTSREAKFPFADVRATPSLPDGLRLVEHVPSEAPRCAVVEKAVEMRSLLSPDVRRGGGEEWDGAR